MCRRIREPNKENKGDDALSSNFIQNAVAFERKLNAKVGTWNHVPSCKRHLSCGVYMAMKNAGFLFFFLLLLLSSHIKSYVLRIILCSEPTNPKKIKIK